MNEEFPAKDFDIKKKPEPPSTSKPIIVGHRPTVPDPMVQTTSDGPEPAKIQINEPAGEKPDESPNTPAVSPKKVIQPLSTAEEIKEAPLAPVEQPSVPESQQLAAGGITSPPAESNGSGQAMTDNTREIDSRAETLPEELKVHLPAGQASHQSTKLPWVILAVVTVIAAAIIAYLITK